LASLQPRRMIPALSSRSPSDLPQRSGSRMGARSWTQTTRAEISKLLFLCFCGRRAGLVCSVFVWPLRGAEILKLLFLFLVFCWGGRCAGLVCYVFVWPLRGADIYKLLFLFGRCVG
jgi:hypothetical protein